MCVKTFRRCVPLQIYTNMKIFYVRLNDSFVSFTLVHFLILSTCAIWITTLSLVLYFTTVDRMKIKSRHVTTHKLRTLSMCKSASQPANQPVSYCANVWNKYVSDMCVCANCQVRGCYQKMSVGYTVWQWIYNGKTFWCNCLADTWQNWNILRSMRETKSMAYVRAY